MLAIMSAVKSSPDSVAAAILSSPTARSIADMAP